MESFIYLLLPAFVVSSDFTVARNISVLFILKTLMMFSNIMGRFISLFSNGISVPILHRIFTREHFDGYKSLLATGINCANIILIPNSCDRLGVYSVTYFHWGKHKSAFINIHNLKGRQNSLHSVYFG